MKPTKGFDPRFHLTIFLGAFLLFQVQPLISKYVLPWYGGTPALWTTCLLFFQVALLAGYAFAHLCVSRMNPRLQLACFLALVLAGCYAPLLPGDAWRPDGPQAPIPHIIAMLAMNVGLPFFALAAAGPLLQSWFGRAHPDRSPYRLYSVSNAGSFAALLSYPWIIAPRLDLNEQGVLWQGLFVLFLAACLWLALTIWRAKPAMPAPTAPPRDASRPAGLRLSMLWIAWSACGVMLFMSVTNQLTLNLASVPFLWVMPLAIYLLSYVAAFSGRLPTRRWLYALGFFPALALLYILLPGALRFAFRVDWTLTKLLLAGLSLFVLCLLCHVELYRLKPGREQLTRFYLSISAGGALGGFFVAIIAPSFFLLYHELHVSLLLCGFLFALSFLKDPESRLYNGRPRWAWGAVLLAFLALIGVSVRLSTRQLEHTIYANRNFYGLQRVMDMNRQMNPEASPARALFHGTILHGMQFTESKFHDLPTLYYGPCTAVAATMQASEKTEGRRIGAVGIGAATVAAYGKPADRITFYELDPDIAAIAQNYFDFLDRSEASWDIRLGDARLRMESEPPQHYDLLMLDAFSGDAIPVHLLTLEAMQTYLRHLSPKGVMLFHISNNYLDLTPVIYQLADAGRMYSLKIQNKNYRGATRSALWIVLSRDAGILTRIADLCEETSKQGLMQVAARRPGHNASIRPWTDQYSNLLAVIN